MNMQVETKQSHSDNQWENYDHSMTLKNLYQSIKNSYCGLCMYREMKNSKMSI